MKFTIEKDNQTIIIETQSDKEKESLLQYVFNGKPSRVMKFREELHQHANFNSNTYTKHNTKTTNEPKKHLIFFKCEHCGEVSHQYQSSIDTAKCFKCSNTHKLQKLIPASYYCKCGKICKFLQESNVTKIKCHTCDVNHQMAYDTLNDTYVSLQSVKVSK